MAGNERYATIDDFSGGENTLHPPDQIGKDEAAKLTNLVPGQDGQPLKVRGGAQTVMTTTGYPVRGLYRYNRSDTSAGQQSYDIVAAANKVYYVSTTSVPVGDRVLLHTFATDGNEIRFSVLNDKLFIANGVDAMVCWDGDPTHAVVVVTDRTADGPVFPYIVTFRDRLWLAGRGSTVMYCGSSDTDATYKRWQIWSGSLESDGGSLVIGADDGQFVTGLAYTDDSLIVFKSRNTYVWTWSSGSIPKTEGMVYALLRGVGCASQDTIRYRDGSVVFLGQADDGEYSVYVVSGSSSTSLSVKIPDALKRILSTSNTRPKAFIHDDVYYLAADEVGGSGGRQLVYAYDFARKAWYEIDGWNVGSFGRSDDGKRLRIGSWNAAKVYEYPLGNTDDGSPIAFNLDTRTLDGGNPMMEHRWRAVTVDAKTAATSTPITLSVSEDGGSPANYTTDVRKYGVWEWDTGVLYDAGIPYVEVGKDERVSVPLTARSKALGITVKGSVSTDTSITRVGAVLRDRKARY